MKAAKTLRVGENFRCKDSPFCFFVMKKAFVKLQIKICVNGFGGVREWF